MLDFTDRRYDLIEASTVLPFYLPPLVFNMCLGSFWALLHSSVGGLSAVICVLAAESIQAWNPNMSVSLSSFILHP